METSFVPAVSQVLDQIFSPVYLLRALLSHEQTNAHETICEQETLHILPKTDLSPHTLFASSFSHLLFHLIFLPIGSFSPHIFHLILCPSHSSLYPFPPISSPTFPSSKLSSFVHIVAYGFIILHKIR